MRIGTADWLVSPTLETLEGDAGVPAVPFDALELPLASLWAR